MLVEMCVFGLGCENAPVLVDYVISFENDFFFFLLLFHHLQTLEEPPYLTVGTDVSAKYRGAFCEAKIKTAKRLVKAKVSRVTCAHALK